jgi:hypothetical protein
VLGKVAGSHFHGVLQESKFNAHRLIGNSKQPQADSLMDNLVQAFRQVLFRRMSFLLTHGLFRAGKPMGQMSNRPERRSANHEIETGQDQVRQALVVSIPTSPNIKSLKEIAHVIEG